MHEKYEKTKWAAVPIDGGLRSMFCINISFILCFKFCIVIYSLNFRSCQYVVVTHQYKQETGGSSTCSYLREKFERISSC
jgi:hypothetical protein